METGRCYNHGGASKSGPAHHSHKHGFYSRRHIGILARAGDAHEALEVMASSHDELAVHKALIDHKLGEVLAAGPSDEAWADLCGPPGTSWSRRIRSWITGTSAPSASSSRRSRSGRSRTF